MTKINVFDEIKEFYKTPGYSSKHIVYWDIYKNIFKGFNLNKKINILEIGVDNGTGMQAYQKIFPNSKICGIDILPVTSNIGKVYIGDQKDEKLLDIVNFENGPFDIVIDDGSHQNRDQIKTFEYLFPKMNPGGIYIVEDIHTSYWSVCGGGYNSNSFVNYSKKLNDLINYWSWLKGYQSSDGVWHPNKMDIEKYKSYGVSENIYSNLNCISFYPNIIVFYKSNEIWEYQAKDFFV